MLVGNAAALVALAVPGSGCAPGSRTATCESSTRSDSDTGRPGHHAQRPAPRAPGCRERRRPRPLLRKHQIAGVRPVDDHEKRPLLSQVLQGQPPLLKLVEIFGSGREEHRNPALGTSPLPLARSAKPPAATSFRSRAPAAARPSGFDHPGASGSVDRSGSCRSGGRLLGLLGCGHLLLEGFPDLTRGPVGAPLGVEESRPCRRGGTCAAPKKSRWRLNQSSRQPLGADAVVVGQRGGERRRRNPVLRGTRRRLAATRPGCCPTASAK